MKRSEKVLIISTGLMVLGLVVVASEHDAVHRLGIKPKAKLEVVQSQNFDSGTFHDLIAKSGVVVTRDALSIILGPSISSEKIDVVTAPSMMCLP